MTTKSPNLPKLSAFLGSILIAAVAACGDSTGPDPDPPAERIAADIRLDATSVNLDDGGTASINATVLDQFGEAFQTPPEGTTIDWQVQDATVLSLAVAAGGTRADLTGLRPGETQVTASMGAHQASAGVTVRQVATQLEIVAGDGQEAEVGETLADSLTVRVTDRHGDGVPGVTVGFVVVSGGGSLSASSRQSDAGGQAGVRWTLGPEAGEQSVEARVSGLTGSPAAFTATASDDTQIVPTGAVEGVVLAANGVTPIPNATVRLLPSGSPPAAMTTLSTDDVPQTTTDAEGRYTLEGVPEGPQTLEAVRGIFRAEIEVVVVAGQTVTADAFTLEPTGRIGYVDGAFDSMEQIVIGEGYAVEEIDAADLASAEVVSQYAMILINCGSDAAFLVWFDDAIVQNLRAFVQGGGLLYVSDLDIEVVERLFPEDILQVGDGDEQRVTATVVDDSLRSFLNGQASVQIEYNFDGWAALDQISSGPEVLLRGNYTSLGQPVQNGPLAIFIDSGQGRLVYTTFHNNALATDDQFAVLRYYLYSTVGLVADPAVPLAAPLRMAPVTEDAASLHRAHRDRLRERRHR